MKVSSLPKANIEEGATCERGTCPPPHRIARKVSMVVIGVLVFALIACCAYLYWSQSR